MFLNIIGRNLNAGYDLKNVIEKKFEKLDKYFSDDIEANVVLSQEKGRQKMEATINAKGIIFRAEETSGDFFDSVDKVVDKLSAQMSKFKGKIRNRYKDNKSLKFEAFGAPLPEDEEAMNVVKKKIRARADDGRRCDSADGNAPAYLLHISKCGDRYCQPRL